MSGFLQRLAVRGAGIAPPGGPVAMRVRPLSRFEPAPHASAQPEEMAEIPLTSQGPASLATAAEQPGPSRLQSPGGPAARGAAQVAAPLPEGRRSASSVPQPTRPLGLDAHPRAPADALGPAEETANDRTDPPPSPAGSVFEPITGPDPPSPAERSLPGEMMLDLSTDAAPGELPPGLPMQRPFPPRLDRIDARHAGPQPEPQRVHPDPAAAPITLAIGRIDIEFVHPPAPPASAAPARAGRTRGFSSYARARRGSPR